MYRYYSTKHPIRPGMFPLFAHTVVNFNEKTDVPGIGPAWGYLEYVERLLSALGDMERAVPACTARRYVDAQGNLYFVRGGLGGVFKGFRRYAEPKPGQRRESGIRSLPYVSDFSQAQLDLDQYARKHRLRQVEAGEDNQGGGERG